MENYLQQVEEKKAPKYSKRKLFLAGALGAIIGVIAYVIYENLDQETKENFTKQLTKTLRNLIHSILPDE